jgi:hypothetical protein
LRVLKKVTDQVQGWPEFGDLLRHRVEGDDGEVFMLSGRLAVESNMSARWSVPSMVDCEASHKEGARVDREVGHWVLIGVGNFAEVFFTTGRGEIVVFLAMLGDDRLESV